MQYTTAVVTYIIIKCKTIYTGMLSTTSNEKFSVYYSIKVTLLKKKINSQLFLGTTAHENVTATNLTLKTSQHKTNLKHENFTVSHHSQLHFCCYSSKTFYNISNLTFTKIGVSCNSVLFEKLNYPNLKYF